jgi:hypothetical protein
MNFVGPATPLEDKDIAEVADVLGCDAAAVQAVCDVEAAGAGFLDDGRPKILFEAHVFGRLTGHQFDEDHPNVSAPSWDRSLYGKSGAHQYDRLAEAMALDETAALKSASWGMFQVMGMNHKACGFDTVQEFVAALVQNERAQLDAFAKFCKSTSAANSLRTHNWTAFARTYNGPGQVDYYANKLREAYDPA